MKSLIAERAKRNNNKIKAEANKSKIKAEQNKAKTTKAIKVEVLEEKEIAPEVKTLMLDVY